MHVHALRDCTEQIYRFCCYPHPPFLEFFGSQVMTQQVTAVGPLLAVVIGIEVLLEMADKVYFSARDSPSVQNRLLI